MSLQDESLMPAEGYAKTAFQADAIPRQAPPPAKSVWGKLGSNFDIARLPWGHYLGINPSEFEYEYFGGWYRDYEYMGEQDFHDFNHLNELRWSKFVDEDISLIYRFFRFWFVIVSHGFRETLNKSPKSAIIRPSSTA